VYVPYVPYGKSDVISNIAICQMSTRLHHALPCFDLLHLNNLPINIQAVTLVLCSLLYTIRYFYNCTVTKVSW